VASGPKAGDPAPDFKLEGPEGPFALSEHRGERVVLLFYPGDETLVCTRQFCSYRDRADELDSLGATFVGISSQGVESKQSFRDHHGLTVPLLADRGGKVAKSYGVHARVGTRRATFVIDEQGIVRAKKVHTIGLNYESVDDLRELLDELPAPA
jgi:peroxiredoxin Q/BCP